MLGQTEIYQNSFLLFLGKFKTPKLLCETNWSVNFTNLFIEFLAGFCHLAQLLCEDWGRRPRMQKTKVTTIAQCSCSWMRTELVLWVSCIGRQCVWLSGVCFRNCNVLPFSCTHLALWRGKGKVKDPRYMQNKKDYFWSNLKVAFFRK